MDIILRNGELIEAITNYVKDKGIDLTNKNVTVSFLAGRGSNGDSATIGINDNNSKDVKTDFTKTKVGIKPKTKRGPKPKVKPTSDEAAHIVAKEAAKATEAPVKDDETLKSITSPVSAFPDAPDDTQEDVKVASDDVFSNTDTDTGINIDTDEISDNKALFAS